MTASSRRRSPATARLLGTILLCSLVETSTVAPAWCQESRSGESATGHVAQPQNPPHAEAVEGGGAPLEEGKLYVLILVGLSGNAEHRELFRRVTDQWTAWLHEVLRIPGDHIQVLGDGATNGGDERVPATREAIAARCHMLTSQLSPDDALWVFFLGHANYDGASAAFHIPGPDFKAIDYARLFDALACRQQVFWITTSSSGWFLEPLSREGRVVMTATQADAEPNETEFPLALVDVMRVPPKELDHDANGEVSLLEMFGATTERVRERYDRDQRAPTEHAMLDDNGDGRGTSWNDMLEAIEVPEAAAGAQEEGGTGESPDLTPRPPVALSPRDGGFAKGIVVFRLSDEASGDPLSADEGQDDTPAEGEGPEPAQSPADE